MPIGWFGLLIIDIGLSLLSRLLAPRLERRRAAPFEAPTTEDGSPIPRGFGIYELAGLIGLVKEPKVVDATVNNAQVTFYYAKMLMGLGWGPAEKLYDIISDERSLLLQRPSKKQSLEGLRPLVVDPPLPIDLTGDDPLVVEINARLLYGGDLEEGGLQGQLRLYRGTDAQPVDSVVASSPDTGGLGDSASAYPWLIYAVFGCEPGDATTSQVQDKFLWCANTPTPKPISFILGHYPNALLGDDGTIGLDANPVEVLYECFTNPVWGKKENPATFDIPQWQEQAQRFKNEGRGVSGINVDRTIDDFKDDLLSHIEGEIVQDRRTGLHQIKCARPDYIIANLPRITGQNAWNVRQGEAQFAQTLNEVKVKYRRFDSGGAGDFSNLVLYTVNSVQYSECQIGIPGACAVLVTGPGRNIDNVVLTQVRASVVLRTLTNRVDYVYDTTDGWFILYFKNLVTDWAVGDEIKVSFRSAPLFSGFVDATVTSQNPANRLIQGRTKSQAYDYPFYTSPIVAQQKANLLIKTVSRKLAVLQWAMYQDGAYITPMDVVNFDDEEAFGLSNFPVRVTKVTIGALETGETLFEGVEDVWGESVDLQPPPASDVVIPPVLLTAPPMAALYCTGADTLAIQASDSTFLIELQRADDMSGTGAVDVAESPLPGTTTTYTDATTGKTHRARMIRDGWLPGPWTAWVAVCTAGDVACVRATIVDSVLKDGVTGTLASDVTDPQLRAQLVEFRITTAAGLVGEWTTVAGPSPYISPAVTMVDGLTAYIARRLTSYDCAGNLIEEEAEYPFTLAVATPPPPIGLQGVEIPVRLVTGTIPLVLRQLPAAATDATAWRGTEDYVPAAGATAAHCAASISYTTAPVGAFLAVKFESAPGVWEYLDGVDGPHLPVDEASLDALDSDGATRTPKCWNVQFDPVLLLDTVKADVRFKLVVVGGDDVADVEISAFTVWLTDAAVDGPASETPPPSDPTPDPGSCTTPTPLDVRVHDSQVQPSGAVWSVVGTDVLLTLSGTGTGVASQTKVFGGGTPGEEATFYLRATTDTPAVHAFLAVTGGDTAVATLVGGETLVARGLRDGSGNITVSWGVQNIENAPAFAFRDLLIHATLADYIAAGWTLDESGGGTLSIESSDTDGAAHALKGTVVNGGNARVYRDLTVTPGVQLTFRCKGRDYANNNFDTGSGFSADPGAGTGFQTAAWSEKTFSITPSVSSIRLYVGRSGGFFGINGTYYGIFSDIRMEAGVGASTTVTFSDLGSCVGSGLGDGVTGLGGTPTTPPNDPIPPPPVGGTGTPGVRPFMAYALPAAGLDYWNSTNLGLTRTSAKNLLDAAATAGAFPFVDPGGFGGRWLDASGKFSYDLWKHEIDLIFNDPIAGPALLARIADGTAFRHMVIDEPMLFDRWGMIIPFTIVQRMNLYSKSLWPTWKTVIRVQPTHPWFTGHMDGLDDTYGQYALSKGDPTAYLANNLASAAAKGHGLVIGMNIAHFNTEGSSGRMATPTEVRHYGGILASSSATKAFGMWRYYDYIYSTVGMPDAVKYVRDTYKSFD